MAGSFTISVSKLSNFDESGVFAADDLFSSHLTGQLHSERLAFADQPLLISVAGYGLRN